MKYSKKIWGLLDERGCTMYPLHCLGREVYNGMESDRRQCLILVTSYNLWLPSNLEIWEVTYNYLQTHVFIKRKIRTL